MDDSNRGATRHATGGSARRTERAQPRSVTPWHPGSGDGADATVGVATECEEGYGEAQQAEPNRLLRALPPEEYARLRPQLTAVRLGPKQVLVEPDAPIDAVYFLRTGVGSMLATDGEGGEIEVGTFGHEGFVGLPVLHGVDRIGYQVVVAVEGDAWRLPADAFRQLVDERPAVRQLLLRYAQYFAEHLSQSVACNRLHTVEERCGRWLLMTHDRVHGEPFELTHESLALMLGVRRAGVTVAMCALQAEGVVQYSRGRVTVRDRQRLEAASCGCYHATRASLHRLLS